MPSCLKTLQNSFLQMNVPKPTLHVMKAGSHLGALGALLKRKPKPESQPEKTTDSAATETEVKEKAVK